MLGKVFQYCAVLMDGAAFVLAIYAGCMFANNQFSECVWSLIIAFVLFILSVLTFLYGEYKEFN